MGIKTLNKDEMSKFNDCFEGAEMFPNADAWVENIKTVSYTHLDVYKRQVLRWVHQGRFDNSWKDGANQMTGDSVLAFLKKGRLEYLLKKRCKRA